MKELKDVDWSKVIKRAEAYDCFYYNDDISEEETHLAEAVMMALFGDDYFDKKEAEREEE